MTDCPHHFAVTSTEPAAGSSTARTITFTCEHCGATIVKVTARSDAEIQAELDAQ